MIKIVKDFGVDSGVCMVDNAPYTDSALFDKLSAAIIQGRAEVFSDAMLTPNRVDIWVTRCDENGDEFKTTITIKKDVSCCTDMKGRYALIRMFGRKKYHKLQPLLHNDTK